MTLTDLTHIAVYDLETTGPDPLSDRVVTAFIGVMGRDGNLIESYRWLVNPGIEISAGATAIHGITNEIAQADGMNAAVAVAEITAKLRAVLAAGIPVVAYNCRFDLTMIDREARRYEIEPLSNPAPIIDPMVIDKAIDMYRPGSRKLIDTCAVYGVQLVGAHDAEADATATGRLAWKILDRLPNRDVTLDQVHRTQVNRARAQAISLQAHFRSTRDPNAVVEPEWPVISFTEVGEPEPELVG